MTNPVSLLPPMGGWALPPATVPQLTDDEQRLVTGLAGKLVAQIEPVLTRWAYYDGVQRVSNLGISVPEQLQGVRTVVDWPRICVDPLVDRAQLSGFRLPNSTEVDTEMAEHFEANNMGSELSLAILDSLVAGRGYLVVGAPDEPGDSPLITVESPTNMAVTWDPRTRCVTAAYQAYEVEGVFRAVLYLPDQTISMSRDQNNATWTVDDRDQHRFGEVPVVRLPNRSRSSDRQGRSEITAPIMDATDSACRTLLGMEIAREVYSIPHLAILGAVESDFVGPDGSSRSALQMAMTQVLAFERDENGELPQLQQLKAFDPSVFTKIIDNGAQRMAAYTGFPPSYFGQVTTANPASADAIRVALNSLDRAGARVQRQSTGPLRRTAQLVWRFAHRGQALPDSYRKLEVDWVESATPTPAATSDAITKQISAGAIPARSDVTLARLGYSPVERARLAQDLDAAMQLEAQVASSIAVREARANNAVATDLGQPLTNPSAPAPVQPGVQTGR